MSIIPELLRTARGQEDALPTFYAIAEKVLESFFSILILHASIPICFSRFHIFLSCLLSPSPPPHHHHHPCAKARVIVMNGSILAFDLKPLTPFGLIV